MSEGRGAVNVPTLLLTGNKDPWVNLESIVKSSDYVEKFLVKMVEGAGHFPHQECPEAVNNHLLSFLIGKCFQIKYILSFFNIFYIFFIFIVNFFCFLQKNHK